MSQTISQSYQRMPCICVRHWDGASQYATIISTNGIISRLSDFWSAVSFTHINTFGPYSIRRALVWFKKCAPSLCLHCHIPNISFSPSVACMHNKPLLSASTGHSGPFKHTLSLRGCLELLAPAISPPAPAPSQALKLWQRNKKALSMINRWAKPCQSCWVWGRDRCTSCPRRHTPPQHVKTWWKAQPQITITISENATHSCISNKI